MEKKPRKQFVFDIHPDLHKRVKIDAVLKGVTINYWMQRAIFEKLARDEGKESCNS